MQLRPVSPDDVPAVAALVAGWETHWFGAPEQDEDELRELLGVLGDLGRHTSLAVEDGAGPGPVGVAWRMPPATGTVLVPVDAPDAVRDALVAWCVERDVREVEALDRDTGLRAALDRAGWRPTRSSFELIRAVTADWRPAAPQLPAGVRLSGLTEDDEPAVHELLYTRTGWADVPGHHVRSLTDWRRIFLTSSVTARDRLVAWDGERPVGVSVGKTFPDGTGWVAQLAVDRDHQGRGLGRALLLESFGRRVEDGATRLGLGVSAANRGALGLYRSVGLDVDREWLTYEPA